jgi:elongation factor G
MPNYTTSQIRNVALVGHAGAGKTILSEAILHACGVINRIGSIEEGTTRSDFEAEEKERQYSIDSSALHAGHNGNNLNLIDCPGGPDFIGPAIAALGGVETAVVVVSASAGIQVNTRRMMNMAKERGLARAIVINKIDSDNIDLPALVETIQQTFGNECQPINLPTGGGSSVVDVFRNDSGETDFGDAAEAHTAIVEAIVESDEALMEQYLESGEPDHAALDAAVGTAVASGALTPIFFTDARSEVGVAELLDAIDGCFPGPDIGMERSWAGDEEGQDSPGSVAARADGPIVAQVIKVFSDPKSNIKYSITRVFSGTLTSDSSFLVGDERKGQRPGHLFKIQGGEHDEFDAGIAGDLIAIAKLDLHVGSTLHDESTPASKLQTVELPTPMNSLAIEPKRRGDESKISEALARLQDADPCFRVSRDSNTNELIISGMGDLHLRVMMSKLARYFKVEVEARTPRIPYRETISGSAKYVEYTHKKQSGGAGQFARVFIDMEPLDRGGGYEFEDKIFGGSIDQSYRPSVDKGIRDQMTSGVVAGFPVVDVKVSLVDGKTHPVDSKDIAFQIAGREVFRKAFGQCKPVLLEPIADIEVNCPAENVGDVTGDLSSRRGRVQGQEMLPGNMAAIRAQAPLSEIAQYGNTLSSITGGQGSYFLEMSHYEQVPSNVQAEVVKQYRPKEEE